jgi:hypothetical protein
VRAISFCSEEDVDYVNTGACIYRFACNQVKLLRQEFAYRFEEVFIAEPYQNDSRYKQKLDAEPIYASAVRIQLR